MKYTTHTWLLEVISHDQTFKTLSMACSSKESASTTPSFGRPGEYPVVTHTALHSYTT